MGKLNHKTSFIEKYEYLKFVDLQEFPHQQVFLLVILHYCHWWIQAGWILQQAHLNLYKTWIINIRGLLGYETLESSDFFFDFFVGNKVKNQDLILVLFLSRFAKTFHWKDIKVVVYRHMSNWVISLVQQNVGGLYQGRITIIRCWTCRYTVTALYSECYFVG